MRRFILVAVLVAGTMAGGKATAIAAPSFANTKDRVPSVDVELVIAVDVSYSMDTDELSVQREGYAQAITSKEFLQALKTMVIIERPEGHCSVAAD